MLSNLLSLSRHCSWFEDWVHEEVPYLQTSYRLWVGLPRLTTRLFLWDRCSNRFSRTCAYLMSKKCVITLVRAHFKIHRLRPCQIESSSWLVNVDMVCTIEGGFQSCGTLHWRAGHCSRWCQRSKCCKFTSHVLQHKLVCEIAIYMGYPVPVHI